MRSAVSCQHMDEPLQPSDMEGPHHMDDAQFSGRFAHRWNVANAVPAGEIAEPAGPEIA